MRLLIAMQALQRLSGCIRRYLKRYRRGRGAGSGRRPHRRIAGGSYPEAARREQAL
jgi:hypothetical protein